MAQTKEHVFLAKTLGVNQIIINVNKMDATKPEYSEERFNKVKEDVSKLLRMVGYKDDSVQYVPTSAFKGDNAVKKSGNLGWWKGPTLLECLDNLTIPPKPTELPLRLPVQDVYTITGIGTVPVGRVETGVLKVGENVTFSPSGAGGEVKTITRPAPRTFMSCPTSRVAPGPNLMAEVSSVKMVSWSMVQSFQPSLGDGDTRWSR